MPINAGSTRYPKSFSQQLHGVNPEPFFPAETFQFAIGGTFLHDQNTGKLWFDGPDENNVPTWFLISEGSEGGPFVRDDGVPATGDVNLGGFTLYNTCKLLICTAPDLPGDGISLPNDKYIYANSAVSPGTPSILIGATDQDEVRVGGDLATAVMMKSGSVRYFDARTLGPLNVVTIGTQASDVPTAARNAVLRAGGVVGDNKTGASLDLQAGIGTGAGAGSHLTLTVAVPTGGNPSDTQPTLTAADFSAAVAYIYPTSVIFQPNGQVMQVKEAGAFIGTTPDILDASAYLQIDSTTKGFAPPRMTTAQINAIASPLESLQAYDLTLHALKVRTNSAWNQVAVLGAAQTWTAVQTHSAAIALVSGVGISAAVNTPLPLSVSGTGHLTVATAGGEALRVSPDKSVLVGTTTDIGASGVMLGNTFALWGEYSITKRSIAYVDASGNTIFGDINCAFVVESTSISGPTGHDFGFIARAGQSVYISPDDNNIVLQVFPSGGAQLFSYSTSGPNDPGAGVLSLPNAGALSFRNNLDTLDHHLVALNVANIAQFGKSSLAAAYSGTLHTFASNVQIGTGSKSTSAALEVISTTQGFLPPRLTTTECNTLETTAVAGTIVWNSTMGRLSRTDGVQFFHGDVAYGGPFSGPIAASQTNALVPYGSTGLSWIVMRAGQLLGLSVQLSAALTGATNISVAFELAINGFIVGSDWRVTFTRDGGQTILSAVTGGNLHVVPVVPTDRVDIRYTSGALTNVGLIATGTLGIVS